MGVANRLAITVAALLVGAPVIAVSAPARTQRNNEIVYSFQGGSDGAAPSSGGLTADAGGELYGVTVAGGVPDGCGGRGCGTVFRLVPPAAAGRPWTKQTLYRFSGGADGGDPYGKPLLDPLGNVYGTAGAGGASGSGTVWKLSPPAAPGGSWTRQTLHAFGGSDGAFPLAGLAMDPSGTLYGTTRFGGTLNRGVVFSLAPPPAGATPWTETVLHSFGDTGDGFILVQGVSLSADSSALFGATESTHLTGEACGTIYALRRHGGAWNYTQLYRFACGVDGREPHGGVLVDRSEHLFGTTAKGGATDDGTVFELSPPARGQSLWTKRVLHSFSLADGDFPSGDLVAGPGKSALFGTAAYGGPGGGVVFRLDPPASGEGPWTYTLLHAFTGPGAGATPVAGLTFGRDRLLFGTTTLGGAPGYGTIFSQPPD